MEALRNTQETQLREVVQLLKTKSTSSEPQVLYEWCRYWNYSWIKTYSISDIHIVLCTLIWFLPALFLHRLTLLHPMWSICVTMVLHMVCGQLRSFFISLYHWKLFYSIDHFFSQRTSHCYVMDAA